MPERTIPLDVRSLMLRALLDTRRLYLGLSDSEAIDGAPLLLLESGELETDGYRRQAIEPASWTIAPDGEAVVARVVNTAFVNVGPRRWPQVRSSFLTTSPIAGEGVMLWAAPLANGPRVLAPADVLVFSEIRIEF